jgi:hypothetical protein
MNEDELFEAVEKIRADTEFVESETGAVKGRKLAQLGAIDPDALLDLAKLAGHGAQKYDRLNYLKGHNWSMYFDAMMRHALAFWAGEEIDPETGLTHMVHAAWCALALSSYFKHGIGTDDRFRLTKPEK